MEAQNSSHNNSHHHNHLHSHGGDAQGNIGVAFWLNAFFVVVEIVGGILTNSIAILSDALHDFGDCLSLAVAWAFQRKSKKRSDKIYSYGYKRYSLLGSIFLSGVLTISSIFVLYEASQRVFSPQDVDAPGMMWLAIAGIAINGAAALKVKKGTSLNEKAVYLHILEDVLGWVAVLIASVVMQFVELPILDPLMSIAISLWVLINVYKNIKATFRVLLQAVPDGLNADTLSKEIESIEGIESLHDLHVWTMDGESHIMTLHVVTQSENHNQIRESIYAKATEYNIKHITIEFEKDTEGCHYINDCSNNL